VKHKRRHHQPQNLSNIDRRISPDDYRARAAERDLRASLDTRAEAQRWLGDPAPARSALAQRAAMFTRRDLAPKQ
jgi:hypothetical protein